MEKIKKFWNAVSYEVVIAAGLIVWFLTGRALDLQGWSSAWNAMDYSMGTGSRLLIGSIYRLFYGEYLDYTVAYKYVAVGTMLTILVLAIVLASGGKGAVQSGASNVMNSDYSYQVNTYNSNGFSSYAGHMFGGSYSPWALIFALVGAGVVVAAALIGTLLKIFVCNVFEVGGRSFYIENLYAVPGVGKLLSAFRSGYYGNVVKTMFFRDLFTFLWSLLFIIPGIIKSYEYKMVPYLLAEYPDMDRKEVFARSRDMMYGQKWNTFVLDLSFIPWNILSTITFGLVGLFYVSPYQDATYAELYDALAAGMPGNNGQRVYGNGNYYYD